MKQLMPEIQADMDNPKNILWHSEVKYQVMVY